MKNRPAPIANQRLAQLRALADPTRLHILALLKQKGCCSCDQVDARAAGMCVCDLEEALDLTQPTITHHLQVLRQAGLVECTRLGPWLYCRRNEAALRALGAAVAGL
jgi:ArsR family transcriptional regulator